MAGRASTQLSPPKYLYENYNALRCSDLILNKSLSPESIQEFQKLLNAAQPDSHDDNDNMMRAFVQFLYRKNPTNFCGFLIRSRLSPLILWTEAKCIVRHFGLRGALYIKWGETRYECSLHRSAGGHATRSDRNFPELMAFDNDQYADMAQFPNFPRHPADRMNPFGGMFSQGPRRTVPDRAARNVRRGDAPTYASVHSRQASPAGPQAASKRNTRNTGPRESAAKTPDKKEPAELKDSDYDEVDEADARSDAGNEPESKGSNKNAGPVDVSDVPVSPEKPAAA
jgi:hypothetical protein